MNMHGGDQFPLVSVVVPAYNSGKFLLETLRSIELQTLVCWEIIIIDDGSNDDTFKIATTFSVGKNHVHAFTGPNRGPSAARALGCAMVSPSSRYILFLDSDDVLESNALCILYEYMESRPSVTLTHFACLTIDCHGKVIDSDAGFSPMKQPRYVPWIFSARKLSDNEKQTPFISIYNLAGIVPSTAFLRLSAFKACGGWDVSLKQMYEDTDLWLRMALVGDVHYLPKQLVRYRRHAAQSTSAARADEFEGQLDRFYRKWLDDKCLSPQHREVIKQAERFRVGGLAVYKNLQLSRSYLSSRNYYNALRHTYGAIRALLKVPNK